MSESYTFLSRVPHFEPAARDVPAPPLPAGPDAPAGGRHAPGRGRHRPSPHSGASPRSPAAPPDTAPLPPRDVHRFTEQAFRLVLEVLDRRRNVRHLRPLVSPPLIDVVRTLALADSPGRRLGVATLVRVHLRAVEPGAYEAFGTYGRGPRVFVIAARVERASDTGWTVTSMVVG
ncbi:Rv3235 family protein [Rhodococcus sp. NPDC056960]|uniref:Rv3235 family protein n=1 Tax=Rhodococcus sp. NPDC056960 TaxID=3345982 RepID=UPI00363C7AF5